MELISQLKGWSEHQKKFEQCTDGTVERSWLDWEVEHVSFILSSKPRSMTIDHDARADDDNEAGDDAGSDEVAPKPHPEHDDEEGGYMRKTSSP